MRRQVLVIGALAFVVAASKAEAQLPPDQTEDALGSKLFIGSTGRSLKRGEGYFGIDSLFLPVMQVGITDRLSVGFGAPFYGLLQTGYVTPKFQVFENDHVAVATGLVQLKISHWATARYAYTAATIGGRDNAVTFGGGWLHGRSKDDSGGAPMFTIGGERRTGARTKFITENYIFHGGVIVTAGERYMRPTFSFEMGAIKMFSSFGPTMPPGLFFNFVWHSRAGQRAAGKGQR